MREYRKKIAKTSVGKTTGSIRGAEIEGVAKWGWPLEGQRGPYWTELSEQSSGSREKIVRERGNQSQLVEGIRGFGIRSPVTQISMMVENVKQFRHTR